eukprot:scaffold1102_cov195-Alexandrium_tamarense.AAC.30
MVHTYDTPPQAQCLAITFLAASISFKDVPPLTSCCTVFIVSNGANNVLEQAAASPDASVFLSPSMMAVLAGFVADEALVVAAAALPPRGTLRTND